MKHEEMQSIKSPAIRIKFWYQVSHIGRKD